VKHNNETNYEALVALDCRWGNDTHAQDGMMAGGWRVVRRGGWVKAFGYYWQHDDLLPYVGRRVWMSNSTYWRQECSAYRSVRRIEDGKPQWICYLKNPKDSRK
jgi:hypothetical protein